MKRRYLGLVVLAVFSSMGAQQQRTQNFIVHAPTQAIAQQLAQYAEHYRREKAIEWLGQEMPPWPQPCPLYATVSMEPPSGATSFSFGGGRVQWMKMEIRGPLDRLIASVLPHEITHTVFAHHFGCPVPRWADEGGSVLSEDDIERTKHDQIVRNILNQGQQIPLRRLFALKEYPPEVICLYAQGFSMSDYLVKRSSRRQFLDFVGYGMQQGWDRATAVYYGHRSVDELEAAWLKYLRDTRSRSGGIDVARAKTVPSKVASRNIIRLTLPPVQPLDPPPVVRGAMPAPDQVGQSFGQPPPPPPPPPGFMPANAGWTPVFTTPTVRPLPADTAPPTVRLGAPIFVP